MPEASRSTASGDGGQGAKSEIDRELAAIKEEMAQISKHVNNLLGAVGNEATRTARTTATRARKNVEEAVSGASDWSRETAEAALDARDDAIDAVEQAIYNRPFTALAVAAGIGFLLGVASRK